MNKWHNSCYAGFVVCKYFCSLTLHAYFGIICALDILVFYCNVASQNVSKRNVYTPKCLQIEMSNKIYLQTEMSTTRKSTYRNVYNLVLYTQNVYKQNRNNFLMGLLICRRYFPECLFRVFLISIKS